MMLPNRAQRRQVLVQMDEIQAALNLTKDDGEVGEDRVREKFSHFVLDGYPNVNQVSYSMYPSFSGLHMHYLDTD